MSIIMYKQRFAPPADRSTPIRNYLHIGYIATRPRSMKNEDGIHGLFGCLSPTAVSCDKMPWQETAKYVRQLSKQKANIFRSIISFHRPDADELGLADQKDWREYAEQHIRTLAEKNGIDISNLGWCGAYHNEGDHPHLHIVFWDKAQKVMKNYVPPKVPNDIRIALIKETFADKISALYGQKKLAKEAVAGSYDKAAKEFDAYMKAMRPDDFKAAKSMPHAYGDGRADGTALLFDSDGQLAAVAERLFRLRDMVPKGGRVAYKLLPPEAKAEIDGFTDELVKNNTCLQTAIGQYTDSLCSLKRLYNSLDGPGELEEYRNKCGADARKQISYKIVKSIRAVISKEHGIKDAEYTAARKQYYAMELMREILDFFAWGTVANHSQQQEEQNGTFRELSDRAIKEWYRKNKDKGMEF